MYKVVKRSGSVFGNEPYTCEFVCDTASDISTLPTSTTVGTGGKTEYDNQVCGSGSIATMQPRLFAIICSAYFCNSMSMVE